MEGPLIEVCSWDEARPRLAETLEPDEIELEREHTEGLSTCWRVNGGACYLLTRGERTSHGRELVLIAAKGRGLAAAMREIQRRAKHQGVATLRFHTRKPALGRLAARYGFTEAERVYRAEL